MLDSLFFYFEGPMLLSTCFIILINIYKIKMNYLLCLRYLKMNFRCSRKRESWIDTNRKKQTRKVEKKVVI